MKLSHVNLSDYQDTVMSKCGALDRDEMDRGKVGSSGVEGIRGILTNPRASGDRGFSRLWVGSRVKWAGKYSAGKIQV